VAPAETMPVPQRPARPSEQTDRPSEQTWRTSRRSKSRARTTRRRRPARHATACGRHQRPATADEEQGVRARAAPPAWRARHHAAMGEGHRGQDLPRVRGARHGREGRRGHTGGLRSIRYASHWTRRPSGLCISSWSASLGARAFRSAAASSAEAGRTSSLASRHHPLISLPTGSLSRRPSTEEAEPEPYVVTGSSPLGSTNSP
jgi:hypothetical protein